MVLWEHICSSHQAQNTLRNCSGVEDMIRIGSIVQNLKGLVAQADATPLRVKEQASGQLITIKVHDGTCNEDYVLDPIELYAWHLGTTINNQGNGIFRKYLLTFPVKLPPSMREKFRASFERGIKRSLPSALFQSNNQSLSNEFVVELTAPEPIAFAMAALKESNIHATEDGSAFAVFDIGGGTLDFAFGVYREPNEDNDAEFEAESVLEYFYPSGELFFGGEYILWEIAFIVFKENRNLFVESDIPFTEPPNASLLHDIEGLQPIINNSLEAQLNTQTLKEFLRDVMEGTAEFNMEQPKRLGLVNQSGEVEYLELVLINASIQKHIQS
jgi:hypothetical protein